jgi:hypothetical protein
MQTTEFFMRFYFIQMAVQFRQTICIKEMKNDDIDICQRNGQKCVFPDTLRPEMC